ncbi:hypothetical protein ABPG74_012094 [Tetrahymena malaccensis]
MKRNREVLDGWSGPHLFNQKSRAQSNYESIVTQQNNTNSHNQLKFLTDSRARIVYLYKSTKCTDLFLLFYGITLFAYLSCRFAQQHIYEAVFDLKQLFNSQRFAIYKIIIADQNYLDQNKIRTVVLKPINSCIERYDVNVCEVILAFLRLMQDLVYYRVLQNQNSMYACRSSLKQMIEEDEYVKINHLIITQMSAQGFVQFSRYQKAQCDYSSKIMHKNYQSTKAAKKQQLY